MPNVKKKSKKASAKKGQLDHVEALLNTANFMVRYKKWHPKFMAWLQSRTEDDGSNPPQPPPPPPFP